MALGWAATDSTLPPLAKVRTRSGQLSLELGDDVAACARAAAVELTTGRSDARPPIADRDVAR